MARNQSNIVASSTSRDQFVAEYLARREQPGAEKVGFISRIINKIEDAATDTVANSTRFAGRVSAAFDAAGEGFEEAKRLEDVRQAQKAADRAARLGLI